MNRVLRRFGVQLAILECITYVRESLRATWRGKAGCAKADHCVIGAGNIGYPACTSGSSSGANCAEPSNSTGVPA